MSIQLGKLYGVGVGPGDPQLLTLKAVNIFRKVQVIFDIAGPNSQESISGGILKELSDCPARRERLLLLHGRSSGKPGRQLGESSRPGH